MSIRMSGLVSGLDTESIVSQLMSAQSMKKTKVSNKKTKLEWSQDKWKDLNTKLYKLYTDQVSKMRLTSSYKSKTVSSSNESKLTATATSSAPTGSNVVTVDKLASAQYVTGGKITQDGVKATSKLTSISDGSGNNISVGTVFTVTTGKDDKAVTKTLTVKEDTTINDLVTTLKDAGLNASFDEKQGRFFISSTTSGEDNAFTLTSSSLTSDAVDGRNAIENALGYSTLSTTDKQTVQNAYSAIASGTYKERYDATNTLLDMVERNTRSQVQTLAVSAVKSMYSQSILNDTDEMAKIREEQSKNVTDESVANSVKTKYTEEVRKQITDELDAQIADGRVSVEDSTQRDVILQQRLKDNLDTMVKSKIDNTAQYQSDLAADKESKIQSLVNKAVDDKATAQLNSEDGKKRVAYLEANGLSALTLSDAVSTGVFTQEQTDLIPTTADDTFDSADQMVTLARDNLSTLIDNYKGMGETSGASSGALSTLGLGEITGANINGGGSGMTVIAAQDSQITLNGAVLTGTSNSFTANGITFDLKAVTSPGETLSINVTNDVDTTYNMVKDFVKSYNDILKEMNDLFYADSARGYDPLTDDEKEAMTDDQIEKWEKKIKDSLLKGDTTLGGVINSMKNAMSGQVEVDGKKYSLATYGIMTSSDYSEHGLLHIYGNTDDSTYSSIADKLKAALTDDPDTVIDVLSGVAKNLYTAMADKMKTSSMSSALTFYNDKQITKQLKQYKSDISDWDDKLTDMENRYYKQFSAMESAMAKLNAQTSSLTSLFGQSS